MKFQHFSRDHRSAPGAQMDRQESALEFRTRSNTIKQGGSQGRPSNHSIKQRVSAFPNRQGAPFGLPKSHSKALLVPAELPLDVYGRQNDVIGRSRTSKLTSYGRFSKKTLKSCSENEWSKKNNIIPQSNANIDPLNFENIAGVPFTKVYYFFLWPPFFSCFICEIWFIYMAYL